jgi:hypothetical protein
MATLCHSVDHVDASHTVPETAVKVVEALIALAWPFQYSNLEWLARFPLWWAHLENYCRRLRRRILVPAIPRKRQAANK